MLRATRALSAMLTLGACACTFDHGGALPGSPDADVADSPVHDDTRGNDDGNDPNVDGGQGDAIAEGSSGHDAEADSAGRPDGNPSGNDGGPLPDGGNADRATDSGPQPDARFDCSAVPNGVTFTPPGGGNAHCYWVHTANNWLGSANACAAERGHLVTIGSSAETTFVLGLVAAFPSNDRLWIGATDGRFSSDGPGSGPFVWITGEPMTYQNWASAGPSQQPDGLCKSCAAASCECEHRAAMTNDGHWEDLYEALYFRTVCEAEL